MSHQKGNLRFLAVIAATLLIIGACSDGQDQAPSGAGKTPSRQLETYQEFDEAKVGEDWKQLVVAARKEGTLLLNTLVGEPYEELVAKFEAKYGIDVQLTQGRISDLATRVLSERGAGQYTVDVWYQTWTVMYTQMLPAGALLPVKPELIHPDVVEYDGWSGGEIRYMDDDQQYLPVLGRMPVLLYAYNPELVSPQEVPRTLDDLLEWEGRVAMALPGQSGDDALQWMYESGHEDFLQSLSEQQPTQYPDLNQGFFNLARGNYAIFIGGTEPRLQRVISEGLPVVPVSYMEEVGPTSGLVYFVASTPALAADAPHPNAAKLFVNWIMTQEGATAASIAGGITMSRADVPTDHLKPHQMINEDAYRNGKYKIQDLEMIQRQPALRETLAEIFNY